MTGTPINRQYRRLAVNLASLAMALVLLIAAVSIAALAAGEHRAMAQVVQPRPATEVRLSAEPFLSIGLLEGADEYLFASGARHCSIGIAASEEV